MMGPAIGQQDRLFYAFSLEDRIPTTHLLRRIDTVLDLSWLRAELLPFYSHTGCCAFHLFHPPDDSADFSESL